MQAGRYLFNTKMSSGKYLKLYKESWSELPSKAPQLREYQNGSIHTTWIISYERIWQVDQAAAKLLKLWAYFDKQDLWYGLLASEAEDLPDWYRSLVRSDLAFTSVIETLLTYSMIESSSRSDRYSMHSVIHDWCLQFGQKESEDEMLSIALSVIKFSIVAESKPGGKAMNQRLLPHATRCWRLEIFQRILKSDECGSSIYDVKMAHLGVFFHLEDKLVEAETILQRLLAGKEKTQGLNHSSTLQTVHGFGRFYHAQDKLPEAEVMFRRVLAGCADDLEPDNSERIDALNSLGSVLCHQKKLAEAEVMFQQALTLYEKIPNPDYGLPLTFMNLGLLYAKRDKPVEAETMSQRALAGCEKQLGPDHRHTLKSIMKLGLFYFRQLKLADAEVMFTRALTGLGKALDPDDRDTLLAVSCLGYLYLSQNKLTQAEDLLKQALTGTKKIGGSYYTMPLEGLHHL